MSEKSRRMWELYLVLAATLASGRAYSLFSSGSPEQFYFQVLCSFDLLFFIPYFFSLLQVILTAFHFIPLALYVFNRPIGSPLFWQIMLSLRIIFDVTGNAYTKNVFISLYQTEPMLCLISALLLLLPYLPWYWACWRYAFITSHNKSYRTVL